MIAIKILIRNQGENDWKVVESAKYNAETELQVLLAESPSLIPVSEIREDATTLVLAVREFGLPGSGNTDILAFSADGDIAIVECKLAANPESKRKVIGQILEYGAYLWSQSYEEVDQRIYNKHNKRLADLVSESVSAPDWDEEKFRTNVNDSLAKGAFILIVAVDRINDELARTIEFLNGCGNPAFSFHALEMRRFQASNTDILVPHLHGASSQPMAKIRNSRKQWTKDEFFQVARTSLPDDVVQLIENIYNWSKTAADRVWFGVGVETGSFTFHYLRDSKTISIFSVYTGGHLTLNYGWLTNQVDKEALEQFHREITSVQSFKRIPANFSKWPSIKIKDAFMNHPDVLPKFKEAVEKLGLRVHAQE